MRQIHPVDPGAASSSSSNTKLSKKKEKTTHDESDVNTQHKNNNVGEDAVDDSGPVIELEHAIGFSGRVKSVLEIHPNKREYAIAAGACIGKPCQNERDSPK